MMNLYDFHKDELDCYLKYNDELSDFLDFYNLNVDDCNILHIIMKDPCYAFKYSSCVLNCRWYEAEQYIMKDPDISFYYATSIIRRRWPEAEPYIKQNSFAWELYCEFFNIC